jgi:asparagine synthase (glutamine-hydrolysing)
VSRLGRRNVQTFSVGYDSPESELDYARTVAAHCKTEHHEVLLTASDFRDRLPNVVWHMDEPLADAPSIPLLSLSEFARTKVTVALSGEGADEVFGGYPTYNRMLAIDTVNHLPGMRILGHAFRKLAPPGKLRKNGSMLGRPLKSRYRTATIFSLDEVARLMPYETRLDDPNRSLAQAHEKCRHLDSLARMSYVDFKTWMPSDLLLKADRMTMARGLELRVPFLDHKLVEFAAKLPVNLKIRYATNKYILKRLMEPHLPSCIIRRAKRGFSMPTATWLRNDLAGFARETLLACDGPTSAFFPRQEITRLLEAHQRRDCGDQIFALLVFDQWFRIFFKDRQRGSTSCRQAGNTI